VIALASIEILVLSGFLALLSPALFSSEALSSNIAQAAMAMASVPDWPGKAYAGSEALLARRSNCPSSRGEIDRAISQARPQRRFKI